MARNITRDRLARVAIIVNANRDLIDGQLDAKAVAQMVSETLGCFISPITIRSAAKAADVTLAKNPPRIGKTQQMKNRIAELERRLVAINPDLVNAPKKRLRGAVPLPEPKGTGHAISG